MDIKESVHFESFKTIMNKAWEDDDFRSSLVANPRAALKAEGFDLPEDMNLEVTDQTDPSTVHLVIPNEEQFKAEASKKLDDMELSDEQLEQISGGEIFFVIPSMLVSGALIGAGVVGAGALGYGAVRGVQYAQENASGW